MNIMINEASRNVVMTKIKKAGENYNQCDQPNVGKK